MDTDSRIATYDHIGVVRRLLSRCIVELLHRADWHDQSKLGDEEREILDRVTPLLAGSTYGSDEYKARLAEMKPMLDHHYANNRHHPEHHADGIRGMTLIDLVEMLCDWWAATKRHNVGDIYRSIEINQKRFGYSDDIRQVFANTVKELEKP